MDGFIGEVRAFAFGFEPVGWTPCMGQVLPINGSTQVLFAVIGTMFGGNGTTNFQLPDLRGQVTMGEGPAHDGISERDVGETAGELAVTLNTSQLPLHNHAMKVIDTKANATDPAGAYWAQGYGGGSRPAPTKDYAPQANTTLAPGVVLPSGAASPASHENRQPYLTTSFCICTEGAFPIRP